MVQRLAHAGIEAYVLNEHAQGALGEIPVIYPDVWLVDDADVPRARVVVADYERARAGKGDGVRVCPACGEENPEAFEVCWRCGAAVDASVR